MGPIPLTVDGNGMVTSIASGYEAPNSEYTNNGVNNGCSPSIAIGVVATDDTINLTEDDSNVAVGGTTLGVQDGATVTVTLNGETYTTTVNNDAWTLNVPAVDAQNLDAMETITADVTNASSYSAAQATRPITHTTAAPTITIGTIAGDDVVNLTEDNSAVTLSGTTANVEDNQTVTVVTNGKTYTAKCDG